MPDILNWCTENRCGRYPEKCCGVNHPALCPEIEPDELPWRVLGRLLVLWLSPEIVPDELNDHNQKTRGLTGKRQGIKP